MVGIATAIALLQDENGEVVESTRETGDPIVFEIGTGDIVGNPIFE